LWLASAVITIFDAAPIAARFFVVLPVLLLAAAALTGTLVRRMVRTSSRRAYLFGVLACLFLAPLPVPGTFFSSWAAGLVFGITLYGLAAVAAIFVLYCLSVVGGRTPTWSLVAFVGSGVSLLLPAHVVVAMLALVGVGSVWTFRIAQSLWTIHHLPISAVVWRRTLVATGIALVVTVIWGSLTGHGLGGTGGFPPNVSPFNASWRESVALTALGAGMFFAIPLAWILARSKAPVEADLYVGTMVLMVAGAIVWGAGLGQVTTFHFFFAGIAVFATPVAVVASWSLWERLRAARPLRLAALALCIAQLEFGVVTGSIRLLTFGPGDDQVPTNLLASISQLPPGAKLAYACRPYEEAGFADPALVSIDAHTGRRVVPMCYQADYLSTFVGAPRSSRGPNGSFFWAPQRTLYPDPSTHPSAAAVAAFLKSHGIDYIYADRRHRNSLVPYAVPLGASGDAPAKARRGPIPPPTVLKIP
jgi:hypothetical protein